MPIARSSSFPRLPREGPDRRQSQFGPHAQGVLQAHMSDFGPCRAQALEGDAVRCAGGKSATHAEAKQEEDAMRTRHQPATSERGILDILGGPTPGGWPALLREGPWGRFPEVFGFGEDGLRVEEFREGNDIVVRTDIPGVDPDKDVEIAITDGVLQIRAERRHADQEAGHDYYRSEVRYGAFERSLPLPAGATSDDVKATYKDGVLEVRVHVPDEASKKTTVPVSRA